MYDYLPAAAADLSARISQKGRQTTRRGINAPAVGLVKMRHMCAQSRHMLSRPRLECGGGGEKHHVIGSRWPRVECGGRGENTALMGPDGSTLVRYGGLRGGFWVTGIHICPVNKPCKLFLPSVFCQRRNRRKKVINNTCLHSDSFDWCFANTDV